jgi:uncharacterized protein (TIGR03118 family)
MAAALGACVLAWAAGADDMSQGTAQTMRGHGATYTVTKLVSDTGGAPNLDPNLVNGWGIAIANGGPLWISSNGQGLSVVYDGNGNQLLAPVTIPARKADTGGAPTGVVTNTTANDFIVKGGSKARFIFAGEDGILAAWTGGPSAVRVARSHSDKAVYKGLAIGNAGGKNFIYVTNFSQSRIDVYNDRFRHPWGKDFKNKKSFVDQGSPAIPKDYGPFGISNIGGKLYVTYAKHKPPENEDDLAGPGNGFVDVFNTDGTFVMRLASHGTLNSPWGVTMSNAGFGDFSNSLIIGNFGDGRINGFSTSGQFLGQLKDASGNPITIDGLWAVIFADPARTPSLDPTKMYFAAGPNDESHGTFGYVHLTQ